MKIKYIIFFFFLISVTNFCNCNDNKNKNKLSQRSIKHLLSIGVNSQQIKNLSTINNSFKQKDDSDKDEKKKYKCGEGLRDLLRYVIDRSDMDAQQLIIAQLGNKKFGIFTGSVLEREIFVKDIKFPIETVDNECFSIRFNSDFPLLLCTKSLEERNRWINAINESYFCEKTKVKGELPNIPGNEINAEIIKAEETVPSGINIHIADSKMGKPQIMLNGMTVQEMELAEKGKSLSEIAIKAPNPSIHDLTRDVDYEPSDPDNSYNSLNRPKSMGEIEALIESEAEHNSIPIDDPRVPKNGYEVTKRGLGQNSFN